MPKSDGTGVVRARRLRQAKKVDVMLWHLPGEVELGNAPLGKLAEFLIGHRADVGNIALLLPGSKRSLQYAINRLE